MPFTKRQFAVGSGSLTGYLYVPDGTGPFQIVAFFHGMGKAGDWPEALLDEGPLFHINKGWKPNFMILALQYPTWTVPAKLMKYAIDNDPEIKGKWDGKNILWTGLSAGGQPVQDAMSMNFPGAFIPMSMAAGAPPSYRTTKFKLWAFHAENDNLCPFYVSKELVDNCNKYFPGSAKLTLMKNPVTGIPDGHGNWNYYYDPAYKEDGKNIYEWAFDIATAVQPTNNSTVTALKAVPIVTNLTSSTATLDGSKSEGKIKWQSWQILTYPPGGTWDVFPGYKKDSLILNLQKLVPGGYTFKLDLVGEGSQISSAIVSFTVPAVQAGVILEKPIPAGATKVILREGNIIEFT